MLYIFIETQVCENEHISRCLKILNRIRLGLVEPQGQVVTTALFTKKNLPERSTGHIIGVAVNAKLFRVQCSIMASAALTKDRLLHYLPGQVKFYRLSFQVIYIKRLFQRNNCYIILKGVLLPNTWASQQHKYLKQGGREPVVSKKKWRWGKLSQISQGTLSAPKYCEFSDENYE